MEELAKQAAAPELPAAFVPLSPADRHDGDKRACERTAFPVVFSLDAVFHRVPAGKSSAARDRLVAFTPVRNGDYPIRRI